MICCDILESSKHVRAGRALHCVIRHAFLPRLSVSAQVKRKGTHIALTHHLGLIGVDGNIGLPVVKACWRCLRLTSRSGWSLNLRYYGRRNGRRNARRRSHSSLYIAVRSANNLWLVTHLDPNGPPFLLGEIRAGCTWIMLFLGVSMKSSQSSCIYIPC